MATIYGLASFASTKVYVGISKNIAKRFREHRCLLRKGKHFELQLQADWDKFGEHQFYMFTIQELHPNATVSEMQKAEVSWMEKYGDRIYNTRRIGLYQTKLGTKQSDETKLKRRLAQLGIPKNHGHKISATKRLKRLMMYAEQQGK